MLGRLLVPAGLDGLVAHVAAHGRRVLQLLLRDLLECLVDVLDCALGRLVARVEGVAYHLQSVGIQGRCWDGYLALQRHLGGARAGGSRASPRTGGRTGRPVAEVCIPKSQVCLMSSPAETTLRAEKGKLARYYSRGSAACIQALSAKSSQV